MKIWITSAMILVFLTCLVYDNMGWDHDEKVRENLTTAFGRNIHTSAVAMASIFLLESIYRAVGFAAFCNPYQILYTLNCTLFLKLSIIRMFGAIANVCGSLGSSFSGGVMFAVVKQCRIPVIAGLRVIFLHYKPEVDEIYQLSVILLGAIAFCIVDAQNMGSLTGMILLTVGMLLRSTYYALTEAYLKQDLKEIKMVDKQMITAMMDVIVYFCAIWAEIGLMGRNWNPFHGLFAHWSYFPNTIANAAQSVIVLPIMQNHSALMVAIINVLAMMSTWLFKLMTAKEKFNAAKMVLILLLGVAVTAYTQMKDKEKIQKAQISGEKDRSEDVTIEMNSNSNEKKAQRF